MLHDQRDRSSPNSFADPIGAIIRLGMAEVGYDFFAVISSIQQLSATRADASAAQSVVYFVGAKEGAVALSEGNLILAHPVLPIALRGCLIISPDWRPGIDRTTVVLMGG